VWKAETRGVSAVVASKGSTISIFAVQRARQCGLHVWD
jgi:hypothetical protein